jgi:hypothetical protein
VRRYHIGMSNQPFDIRSSFFQEHFEKALPYSEYIKTGKPTQIERWKGYENALQLTDAQKGKLSRALDVKCMSY